MNSLHGSLSPKVFLGLPGPQEHAVRVGLVLEVLGHDVTYVWGPD